MSLRDWLMPAATGVAGLVAGLLIANQGSENVAAPESEAVVFPGAGQAPATTPATSPATANVTLEDVRRVVREELASQLRPSSVTPATGSAALENSTASTVAEQNAAAERARAVLDGAIARRTWTDEDREALSAQFPAMSPEQRNAWLQQYAQAVNQGLLVPDSDQPPM